MKVKDTDIVRRFHDRPDSFRLTLLCGPNATRCQALVDELVKPLSGTAERVDLTIAELSESAGRLNDEATSISLFGDKRFIVLRLNSGEAVRATKAIETLLASDTSGDPVFIIAPGMGDKTALAKTIAKAPDALIATCYETSAADAVQMIVAMGKKEGVLLSREMAGEIAAMTSNVLVLAEIEVEKIALYMDAAPENPQAPDADILNKLGAENDEEDLGLLYHSALNGDIAKLSAELATTSNTGFSEIGLLRLMLRHLGKLAELRAKADGGARIDQVVGHPSVFWKDKPHFSRQLNIWSSAHISRLIEKALDMEIKMKSSGVPNGVLLQQELLLISRKAAQLR